LGSGGAPNRKICRVYAASRISQGRKSVPTFIHFRGLKAQPQPVAEIVQCDEPSSPSFLRVWLYLLECAVLVFESNWVLPYTIEKNPNVTFLSSL
jgi:hypothetical protein